MKVSVGMVTYNHERFISQAIESVLTQKTDFPYELVIGEDCSNDGTRAIVRAYKDRYPQRIRLVLPDQNRGPGLNVVATLQACCGQYVSVLEGDDYWTDPLKLQKQVDFLDMNPEYIACHHDAIVIDEDGVKIAESELPDVMKRDFSSDELIKGAWILALTACFRNVLREIPPEFLKVLNADTFLFSMLGNLGCSKYMGQKIRPAAHRHHSGGIWSMVGRDESITHLSNTYYWLSRYYKRVGKKEYSKHWTKWYHDSLISMLYADDKMSILKTSREFLIRGEILLDARFTGRFIFNLGKVLVSNANYRKKNSKPQ